jgi:predicted AlkP superfamily pyrophosphatase or phosphodiesterase
MIRKSCLMAWISVFAVISLAACQKGAPPVPTVPEPTATQETALLPTPTTAAAPVPTQASTEQPEGPHQTVFLISWDGARADLIDQWMSEGLLPHFADLARQGLRAEYAQSVEPSLTAAVHSSIASGSFPARTGIVSNAYHNSNDNFYWYREGFDELMDQAVPVWVAASRAGLTTATVFFPDSSPTHLPQTADYTIGYGVWDAYSRQESLALSAAQDSPVSPQSFSPLLEGEYQIPKVATVYLSVVDSSDDQVTNYDTVLISTSPEVQPEALQLKAGEWGSLVLQPGSFAGADFLIQKIDPESVTFYHTDVYHNTASPRDLLEKLNTRFGFFPAGADAYALEHGWITPEENLYMMERASLWMAEVAAWMETTYRPDLLMTWQDVFDAAGHAFLLQDLRQSSYSPERAAQYASYYRRSAQIADEALRIMLESVDLDTSTLMMVADHGMLPVHTNVLVNTILEQAGLLTLDEKNYVVVEESKALAVASGGAANIYINLKGREKAGFVLPEEYSEIQKQIISLFESLKDPATGEAVFQRVLAHDQLGQLGLDHPNSGDVFIQANPGYNLDDWRGWDDVLEPASFYGQHGYDISLPEMRAMFIAAGVGLNQNRAGDEPAEGRVIPPVSVVDYAPTIAALLGFELPPSIDGQPIPAFLEH